MAYTNLSDFVERLKAENELITISEYVNSELEITEITDRISKAEESRNKAILFTNNGTQYPILINAFGSEKRMCLALNCNNLEEPKNRIEEIFKKIVSPHKTLGEKLSILPLLSECKSWIPTITHKAECQQVIEKDVDLTKIPVLKCWQYDASRFVTLPMVVTKHPETGIRNIGMYRMQIVDKETTGMHWHKHKTGANHYEAYKKLGLKMPVSVALGGDPTNTFSATAPLPENIDEMMLSGFLRKKPVKLVKCVTNDLEVPADSDFVLEGYIDPAEEKFLEGPFGDHTGFYSLPDYYPKFHVTCITHRKNAIYPATIVGIPPMEDAWIGKATERIFLAPIKLLICPELIDYIMPFEGVAHNLVVAKIKKSFEGQVQKVTNAFWGAGQMMFNKTLVIVNEDCDITNSDEVWTNICNNVDPQNDIFIMRGTLDVLDHSGVSIGFGSKMAVDATKKEKLQEGRKIIFQPTKEDTQEEKFKTATEIFMHDSSVSCIILYDNTIDNQDRKVILWNVLNNCNPQNDCKTIKHENNSCLIIDGSTKLESEQLRDLPTPITASEQTIEKIDKLWEKLKIGDFIPSPSLQYRKLSNNNSAWRYNKNG